MQIQESHASSLALQAHQGTAQRGAPGWVCSGSSGAGTWGAQQSRAEPGATAHCSLAAIPQLQIPTSTPTRPRGARTVRAAAAWLMRHDRTQLVHGSFCRGCGSQRKPSGTSGLGGGWERQHQQTAARRGTARCWGLAGTRRCREPISHCQQPTYGLSATAERPRAARTGHQSRSAPSR